MDYYKSIPEKEGSLLAFRHALKQTDISDFQSDFMKWEDEKTLAKIYWSKYLEPNNYNTPSIAYVKEKDTAAVLAALKFHSENSLQFGEQLSFLWSRDRHAIDKDGSKIFYILYAFRKSEPPIITEDAIVNAAAILNNDTESNHSDISVTFDEEMAYNWNAFTHDNVGSFVAITSYNKVIVAPLIAAPIDGTETRISGNLSSSEANSLINQFNCRAIINNIGWKAFEANMMECENSNVE